MVDLYDFNDLLNREDGLIGGILIKLRPSERSAALSNLSSTEKAENRCLLFFSTKILI